MMGKLMQKKIDAGGVRCDGNLILKLFVDEGQLPKKINQKTQLSQE